MFTIVSVTKKNKKKTTKTVHHSEIFITAIYLICSNLIKQIPASFVTQFSKVSIRAEHHYFIIHILDITMKILIKILDSFLDRSINIIMDRCYNGFTGRLVVYFGYSKVLNIFLCFIFGSQFAIFTIKRSN